MNAKISDFYKKNITCLTLKNSALATVIEQSDDADSCYGKAVTAKDGSRMAVFSDGAALFSTYNPMRDAQQFAASLHETKPVFCLVCGMGCGIHIHEILRTFKSVRVLAVEKNAASIKVLFNQFDFTQLLNNPAFFLTLPEQLSELLCRLYVPALFSHFKTGFLRPWAIHNPNETALIHTVINKSLEIIAADYSVQAHFGKIWMRNILRNLQTASRLPEQTFVFPCEKTAHIIAAGPSLDETLPELVKNRKNTYIIATDTALQVLWHYGICADAVVTIDGQNISYLHFFRGIGEKTLLVADLCAHPFAAEIAVEQGNPVLFAKSAHPLCIAATEYQVSQTGAVPFFSLDVSSGTVTAAAVDFAVKAGFSRILLHGADFAYIKGKPYARGTYLDVLYTVGSNRLNTAEGLFSALMYRTELTATANGFTSERLSSYATALCALMKQTAENGVKIRRYRSEGLPLPEFSVKTSKKEKKTCITQYSYLFSGFLCRFIEYTEKAEKNKEAIPVFLLPLAAWVQKKNISQDVLKLAKSEMERYNKKNYV